MARQKKYTLNELMDITTVAAQLDQPVENVRMRAQNNKIGFQIGKLGRVYTPADVDKMRELIQAQTGPKPRTVEMRTKVLGLKAKGLNHVEIARRLEVHPSYIPKLLKLNLE